MAAIALPGALLLAVAPASGQRLVELRIDGPERVIERTTAQYRSFARFDNGDEYEVTLFTDWSLDRDFYASIDRFGRLTAGEVPGDVPVLVLAEFTWEDDTRDAMHAVTLFDVPEDDNVDPWPTWGRTTTRVGNTRTIGPRTPRIDWFIRTDFYPSGALIGASCSMDAHGRIFQGGLGGVTAVDSRTRQRLWVISNEDTVSSSPSVWEGRVYWGVTAADRGLICSDATTAEELWRFNAPDGFNVSPCADGEGVVYFNDRRANVYARRADDGAEVWTVMLDDLCSCPLSLAERELLLGGVDTDVVALQPPNAEDPWEVDWFFRSGREITGNVVLTTAVAYLASYDRFLYAVDRADGSEIWRFNTEQANPGAVALGHDGTIYSGTEGNIGWLFAVSPAGKENWRLRLAGLASGSPVVAGDGSIYITSSEWTGQAYIGRVHAVHADGSEMWVKVMPHAVRASPMLAPDGTLYVMCTDKNLYAFRDVAGDLDHDGDIDLADMGTLGDCMTGPRIWGTRALTPPGCELLDFDRDWDVDVADFARIQIELSAP
jgi:outer membrane protein assembly factor BamB